MLFSFWLPLAHTLDTRLLSIIPQNETSSFKVQYDSVKSKSQLSKKKKKRLSPSVSVDLLKFGMLVSQPALRNGSTHGKYEQLTLKFPKVIYF